jgi:hypothetical protein
MVRRCVASKEKVDDDVRKTIEAFDELGAKYPEFMFKVQADSERRIKNLMWMTGSYQNAI